MAQILETEGSGVPFISDEEPGTSGRAVVTINPVALSKAGTAQHDIASDLERGWSLPAQKRTGIKIAFKGLTYTVDHNNNKRQKLKLLTDVTGVIVPAKMTALMGPSGSGKTTLLDVLAGRKTAGDVSGLVLVGGKPPSRMFMRRFTGYVEQFDTLVENLTVREMLAYTAELKLELDFGAAEKRQRVELLIDALALESCQNVRIGSPMQRGISGGQAKRCNIGIALMADPRILFLDEPTSGLDSYTSQEVMRSVVVLTQTLASITVCATIHSPSPQTFALFDRLIILLRGRIVYFGDNGVAAVAYFEQKFPDVTEAEEGGRGNCAEWLLSITTKADRSGRGGDFAEAYAKSELYVQNAALISSENEEAAIRNSLTTQRALAVKQSTVTPFWWGLWVLLKYRLVANYKDPKFLLGRVVDKLLCCIVLIILYVGLGKNNSPDNLINVSSLLYMYTVLPGFAAISYMPGLVLERPLYIRERSDGLYRTISYLLSKMAEELTVILGVSLVNSACIFYAVAFRGEYVLFWLAYLITMSVGMVVGYVVAAWAPDLDVANGILPGYVMGLFFFTGYPLRLQNLPTWIGWIHYLDFLHYAWAALMLNEFEDSTEIFLGNQTFLEYYGLPQHDLTKWEYLGIELLFFVMFFVLAWYLLAFKQHSKR